MQQNAKGLGIRWAYLVLGVVAMLFAGIIYAWSILKAPFQAEFGWSAPDLALNFTITMCFFCTGGFVGGLLSKRIGVKLPLIAGGLLAGVGLLLASRLEGSSVGMLYLSYGVMAGLGIGVAYNILMTVLGAWFPDKKGLCSGILLMGFGASALVLGNLAGAFIDNPAIGWRTTFLLLGAGLAAVMVVAGLVLRMPNPDTQFPQPKQGKGGDSQQSEQRDYTTGEMLRRPSFWLAFVCLVLLAAVGNSVISFAKDLALSVQATAALATTLVGVLSVCNGLGRIITGALFDAIGRRATMLCTNVLTIVAAGVTLLSVSIGSLPLCVVGLCLTGLSYGSCPTVSAAFIGAFYGAKYYPTNFAIMNFNLMGASLMATVSSNLLASSGGYTLPFMLLLALSVVALVLNLLIRRP